MPLMKGFSKPTISKNIAQEIRHGKNPQQAAAIAFSVARRARKMNQGGMCYSDGGEVMDQPESREKMLDRIFSKKLNMGGIAAPMEMVEEDDFDDDLDEPMEKELYEEEEPSRDKFITAMFMRRAMKRR